MPLAPGSRLGPYEIVSPLGAGGMGEVYRARDPRLGRDVAIKVLPASYAGDADRLRRFEQEARAAGALNHPNVLSIHDIGIHEGAPFVVSELLEGETLRDRIQSGDLTPRRAVEIAVQMARGLAAAHARGIVHRDLKPENLFLTRDGHAKILDFGLAKLLQPEAGGAPLTSLPTTPAGTHPGVVMGTTGYMSPEQVRGAEADHRSDIFSFGVVLHEMLSGAPPFKRDTAVETMSAILKEEPPELSGASRPIAPALDAVVRHCLEKRPEDRFQSARDLAFNLESSSGSETSTALRAAEPVRAGRWRAAALLSTGLALGAAAGAAISSWWARTPETAPPTLSYVSYSGRDIDPTASPDGKLLAFSSDRDGRARIWLKQLPGGGEVALTAGIDTFPRFSPDGSTILFARAEGGRTILYKVPIVGGEPRKVLDDAIEGSWSPDGRQIVYVKTRRVEDTVHYAVGVARADGGDAREIADVAGFVLLAPRWSPDGRTIAVTRAGTQNAPNSVFLVGADGQGARTLPPPPPAGEISTVSWSGEGDTILYAVRDSIVAGGARGGVSRIVRQETRSGKSRILMSLPTWIPQVEVAGPGRLLLGVVAVRMNLVEIPIGGKTPLAQERFLTHGNCIDRQPAYSPDGEWIVFSSSRDGNLDLWMVSRSTAALKRLTDDAADDWDPGFTPDGKSILWSSNRSGHFEIWISEVDGTGARQLTQDGEDAENPVSTPDGKWIVYSSSNPAQAGIWKIRPDGTGATRVVPGNFGIPEISPDGRYVAYRITTTVSGRVYVSSLEDGSPAMEPLNVPGLFFSGRSRWMPDGKRLTFVGQDPAGAWGVYQQDFIPHRDTISTRRPLAGFDPEYVAESYGISPDGSRLTMARSETLSSLMMAEGLPGVTFPQRQAR